MKNITCNKCGHHFVSKAQDKNIRCPKCKSKESFGYILIAILFIAILFAGCSLLELQRADEVVTDLDKIAQGGQAVLASPAGQLIPPHLRIYGVLGIGLANALVLGWEEWRNREMKKTTRAIVRGIEASDVAKNPQADVKKHIAQEMIAQGGEKFLKRANKRVDRLKVL